jgi:REP element-mobilizing transposase RayT
MPRKTRIDASGAIHHVIFRGIERSSIFRDSKDYENFISRLSLLVSETSTVCYAWVLMKNHVHLLLRSGRVPLSSLMRRLLTGYAQQFNRRHNRSGHVFQNRYKSFLCEEDPYLLELVRYIHLNPIRGGAANDMAELEKLPWCGHGAIMGRTTQEWQDSPFVLSLFHKNQGIARRAYYSFVEKGIAMGKRPDLIGGGLVRSAGGWIAVRDLRKSKKVFASDERILGSSSFVASVLKQANEDFERRTVANMQGLSLERLIAVVCDHFCLDPAMLGSPTKQPSAARARAITSHLAFDVLRLRGVEIARQLNVTPSAVSKLAAKGRTDPSSGEIGTILQEKR